MKTWCQKMPEYIGFIERVQVGGHIDYQAMFGEVVRRSEGGEPVDVHIELIWISSTLFSNPIDAAQQLNEFIQIRMEAGMPV